MARDMVSDAEFIEVFVDTPIDVCMQRDPKGLYEKAKSGAIKNFTGIDSPYESPEKPELTIKTVDASPEVQAEAIVAYLRQVKPVHNQTAKSTYKIPLPPAYGPVVTSVPDVDAKDRLAYGRYMATALGHCMDCHTPLVQGRNDLARMGAGGNTFGLPGGGVIVSPNLTPGRTDGLPKWSDAQIKTAIQTGVSPDHPLVRLMAFDWYANINGPDMDALVLYLRSLKPVP
jgi:mono/diheme cytochrome c family protein